MMNGIAEISSTVMVLRKLAMLLVLHSERRILVPIASLENCKIPMKLFADLHLLT